MTLEHPIGPESWSLSAYLSDEGFYDSESGKFVRNRVYAGIKKKVIQNLTLDVYTMRQNDEEANPARLS